MNVDTMYLTAFLVIGGIIFIVLFFHYVPFFLWLSAKVSGGQDFIGAIVFNAYP